MKWAECKARIVDLEQRLARVEQERDQFRYVAEACSLLASRMIAWRKMPTYCIPTAIDAAVVKLEGVFDVRRTDHQ